MRDQLVIEDEEGFAIFTCVCVFHPEILRSRRGVAVRGGW